jgi:hypothetical protein
MTVAIAPPTVEVTLCRGPIYHYWIVKPCPYCGSTHAHGAGGVKGNPRRLLGYYSSHCATASAPERGYILVEAGQGQPRSQRGAPGINVGRGHAA